MIPSLAERQDGHGLSSMTGTGSQRTYTTFEISDALLKYIIGGIHYTGVNIAVLFQREQPGGMIGVFKHIGCGLVNWDCPRSRGRIRYLPGMQLAG